MSSSSNNVNKILASTSRLASYNMLLQLSFRVLTFVLNAFVLRYITKETLGVVNVRLLLLYSTVLFMSREAFRRACLSTDTSHEDGKTTSSKVRWKQTVNLLWCILPVGVICNALATYTWINLLENPDPTVTPHYTSAVYVFGLCAWVELIVEPLWVIAQSFLFIKLKVISEGLAILTKCIVTVVLVLLRPHWGLVSFSIAQVSFSIVYISIFYGYFTWFVTTNKQKQMDDFPFSTVADFFPKFHVSEGFVDRKTAKLTKSFFKQSVLKQLLTEGERYVMTILNVLSFADQGVYDIINNLGSLVARFIFLPIEESFYLFFAKTLRRGEDSTKQSKDEIKAVTHVLFCLLRLVVLIGSVILAFGLPYSKLLLDIYGGKILSAGVGPVLLKFYCFYVLTIAVNGTTECFVFAAMSQAQVDRYNKKMFLFSLLFLVTSYYLTKTVGSVGFILANCLNMLARIIHSVWFINRFYKGMDEIKSPLLGIIPSNKVIVSLIVSSFICLISESYLCCDHGWLYRLAHISIGAVCLFVCCITIWLNEGSVVQFLHEQYFKKYSE
uniref:Protein RFT1 homolog n=1 Tax=Phallusia mammillata TaxID=59560 RepID=A0A6F9DRB9_9ASCI|nr:protein RFT1 homolog [Phallusia mammillata]